MVGQHLAYLFDQVSTTDPSSVLRMNARVAACYTWAEAHGYQVADEIIGWADSSRPVIDVLIDLLTTCHRDGAVLLVHSRDVLPGPVPEPLHSLVPIVVVAATPAANDRPQRHDEAGCG